VELAPQNARSRRTRTALLAAARELVEQEGLGAMTMASIAERAGVTRRAVYLHFASRTDVVTALYEHVNEAEDVAAALEPVWRAPDAVTALDEWARYLARCHVRLSPVGRAFQRVQGSDPDAAPYWDLVMRDWHGSCRRLAAWLADDGRLSPEWTVPAAADMLWALMSFDVLDGLTAERRWSRRRLAKRLSQLFRSTFVTQAPPATQAPQAPPSARPVKISGKKSRKASQGGG
jgi:AcrR family transcriptional regulator